MRLSIVSTLYNSEATILSFYERCTEIAKKFCNSNYEIILVNDGSPDNSLGIAREIVCRDPNVIIVDLSRNFGHHKALMTGLRYAKGENIFLIDSDMEEDPAWLFQFSREMEQNALDSVYGYQEKRKGGFFERVSGWFFYRLFRLFVGFDFPANIITARLMTRRFAQAVVRHRERELSIGWLFFVTGFQQKGVAVAKAYRGESNYTFSRKLTVAVNSIISFSSRPLSYIFVSGVGIFLMSSLYVAYLVISTVFFRNPPSGWTSLMVSLWMIGGIVIACIGIIGIYIAKIYEEVKARPYVIVRDVYSAATLVGGKPADSSFTLA